MARTPRAAAAGSIPRYRGSVPPRSSLVLADELREAVLREHDDGELIGTEEELAHRYGVSAPTARQAVRILQAEGLLRVRRGPNGGVFAQLPTNEVVARAMSLLLRHRKATFAHLAAAMMPIAAAVARAACENPDGEARARAADAILAFEPPEGCGSLEALVAAGLHYREQLAPLVDNPVFEILTDVLQALVASGVGRDLGTAGRYAEGRAYQCSMAEAVRTGDVTAALDLTAEMQAALAGWAS